MKKQLSNKWLKPISDARRDAEKQQEQIRQADQPKCACLEYVGDNPACKIHGHLYSSYSNDTMAGSLNDAGFGSQGIM